MCIIVSPTPFFLRIRFLLSFVTRVVSLLIYPCLIRSVCACLQISLRRQHLGYLSARKLCDSTHTHTHLRPSSLCVCVLALNISRCRKVLPFPPPLSLLLLPKLHRESRRAGRKLWPWPRKIFPKLCHRDGISNSNAESPPVFPLQLSLPFRSCHGLGRREGE